MNLARPEMDELLKRAYADGGQLEIELRVRGTSTYSGYLPYQVTVFEQVPNIRLAGAQAQYASWLLGAAMRSAWQRAYETLPEAEAAYQQWLDH